MLAYGRPCAEPGTPAGRKRKAPPPPIPDPDRREARRLAVERSGLPGYQLDLDTTRGACRARRCASRWAVTRLTVDLRGREVDRYAALECAACGRVWRRIRVGPIIGAHGAQRVLVTAILPARAERWFARGRWHREGDDALILENASIGDLDDAARARRKRMDAVYLRLERAKARRAELESAALAKSRALLAQLRDIDEARASIEAAAQAREDAA